MALLEARGLVKYYGRRCVVKGVDFEVNPGEVVGLLGPNGAGKTTSFKMTMGFVDPNGGKVLFNGQDVVGKAMYERARLGMGYLPQETSIFRKLTVEQNILAILEMMPMARTLGRSLTKKERWERTDKVLDQFGLTRLRKNGAARLSGGEKRRLEIARCLVCEPLLILMDEPFTGIDPKTIADIQTIVIALRNQGIGVLLTDHNVREALKITNRSYLIKDGEVRTHGTPWQIIQDPIAINEYLGAGFNDDSFTRPPPQDQAEPALENLPPLEDAHARPAAPPRNAGDEGSAKRPSFKMDRVPALQVEDGDLDPPRALSAPGGRGKGEGARAGESFRQDDLQQLVESLKSSNPTPAASALVKKGTSAVPVLLTALERRDVELRRQVFLILQKILPKPVVFDPFAPEAVRMQQIASLRDHCERKAG